MAKASWLILNPMSGSNSGTVDASTTEQYNGRVARETIATWSGPGVANVPKTFRQAGRPEFVTIQSSGSVSKEGGTLTITGTSNSTALTFSLGQGTLELTLPETYTANSVETENGAAIAGDPGASALYNFSIAFTIGPNDLTDELRRQLIVTTNGGQTGTCEIVQAGGDPYLEVTPEGVIEIPWQGTAVSVQVNSNINWTVE